MEFIHLPYQPGETIAAIATPPGEGGVAIIRISGDKAFEIADAVFSGSVHSYKTHTAHFGYVVDSTGHKVDSALLLVMHGSRSYTGENTAEIHCHGGTLISRKVLEVVLQAGARAALPGEFTSKAFLNGKIDLAQAEAVQELIAAKNDLALEASEKQLQGELSRKIESFQEQLTSIAAILEAWVDFPEEGLEFASMEEVCEELETIREDLNKLVNTFHNGKIIHDGIALCLVGSPNVGKSSLMNALLDKERAIVSDIPGTTRDLIEDQLRINGLNFKLIDTAGIRKGGDQIEEEGMRRSLDAMKQADLILWVLDLTQGMPSDYQEWLQRVPLEKTIVIWNKSDLPHVPLPEMLLKHQVAVSAKERWGLEDLHREIDKVIWQRGVPSREELLITNVRHKEALQDAEQACLRVIEGLKNEVSPEFLTMDMRQALSELGKIIGTNISEDILSAIFSKFCIGK